MAPLRTLLALAALSGSQPAGQPAGRWGADVAEASARFGIPAEWVRRVIQAESSGRTTWLGRPVVSPAGAMGLMQLMPATWRDMRDTLGLGPDPHDPRDNTIAGTAYLRAMYDRFGYPGLFAAYNAGPARYAAYLAGRASLPSETQAYLDKMTAPGRHSAPPPMAVPRRPDRLFALERPGTAGPSLVTGVPQARLFVVLRSATPDPE